MISCLVSLFQMKVFEEELIIKTAKMVKKKKMKMKKEGEKAEKNLQNENQKIQKDLEDKEIKRKADELKMELDKKNKIEFDLKERKRKKLEANNKRLSTIKQMEEKIVTYNVNKEAILKKLKIARKKLRDIDELAAKISGGLKASKEQKEKVEKKQSVEDDIAELEEAEDDLKDKEPPAIPASLLIEESDIDFEVGGGGGGGGISSSISISAPLSLPPPSSNSPSAVTSKTSLPISKSTLTNNVKAGGGDVKKGSKGNSKSDPWSTVDTSKKTKNK